MSRPLALAHGLTFADLHSHGGLTRIDALFGEHLRAADAGLADRLAAGRAVPDALAAKAEADLLLALAPHVEDFLADLPNLARCVGPDCKGQWHKPVRGPGLDPAAERDDATDRFRKAVQAQREATEGQGQSEGPTP